MPSSLSQAEWSVPINPLIPEHTHWFIEHRKDFGNIKVITGVLLTYYLMQGLFLFVGNTFFPSIQVYIDIALYVFEFTVLTVIWNKIPESYDAFLIKDELRMVLRVGLVPLVLYIAFTIKTSIVGVHLISFMAFQCLFGIGAGVMGIILNGYIFKLKNRSVLLDESSPKNANAPQYTFSEVLSNTELIRFLSKHLSDEFSVELLLAFIEIQQFKEVMQSDTAFMASVAETTDKCHETKAPSISLPLSLPQSVIVHSLHSGIADNVSRYLSIAQSLCAKYIENGSVFQVNISFECKQNVLSFMGVFGDSNSETLSQNEKRYLFHLFEDTQFSLRTLLRLSHQRCLVNNRYPTKTGQIK